MTEQHQLIEVGTMSGFGMAQDSKYRNRRLAEIRREQRQPGQKGVVNVAGWEQLATVFGQMGMPVQHAGDRLIQ